MVPMTHGSLNNLPKAGSLLELTVAERPAVWQAFTALWPTR
jgi:hypothetical protein